VKKVVAVAVMLFSSSVLLADISVTDRTSTLRFLTNPSALTPRTEDLTPTSPDRSARQAASQVKKDAKKSRRLHGLTPVPSDAIPADRAARQAANKAKHDAKMAKHHGHGLTPVTQSFHPRAQATARSPSSMRRA